MGEFELIRRYFLPLSPTTPQQVGVALGQGDDAALLNLPPGHQLAVSVDTLVAGVHFPAPNHDAVAYDPANDSPAHDSPADLGWRALAVAASDLAAMGADPQGFLLAITLPENDQPWLLSFSQGLAAASRAFALPLVGGDTTRGPLTLSLTVMGSLPAGTALTRGGAQVGDLILVSGPLGAAGEALKWLHGPKAHDEVQNEAVSTLLHRYWHPQPRLALGQWLRGKATAAIDISDGLAADLAHLLTASGVGGLIETARLPMLPALLKLAGDAAIDLALTAGDDYELCFTLPGNTRWLAAAEAQGCVQIGEIESSPGLRLATTRGVRNFSPKGYDHFGQ